MTYLTIGTLWKDEYDYALDFWKYHKYIGVEKLIIFDREYHRIKELFKDDRSVEVYHFPENDRNTHQEAWGQLIGLCKGKTKWLALIDADQCLVPVKTNNAKDVLKNYEEFACVQMNWKAAGSDGKLYKEPGSIYERFLHFSPKDSRYSLPTQFICQPDRTISRTTEEPHYPHLPPGEMSVNTNKEEISANKIVAMNPSKPKIFNVPALHDIMWVAHYTNKSKEEWIAKNSKGRADIPGAKIHSEQFNEYDAECTEYDGRVSELWKIANENK